MGKGGDAVKLPKIFYVNWFRRDESGNFVWPGFGENIRVIKWALERIEGTAAALDTPIGRVPAPGSLDVSGLELGEQELRDALAVREDEWRAELPLIDEWFDKIGDTLPTSLRDELDALKLRLTTP
jgi:phosphoenolpyruvate carboxykinase (GTP)